jgi:hypothetical protein
VSSAALPSRPATRTRAAFAADLAIAGLAGLLALGLYLRTLAPGLLWGDSAEFQFAAWLGGFTHPTGYPLYLSLGWVWTHLLPWYDPAWRMNLFSAVWGAVATGLMYLLALHLLRRIARPMYRRLTALAAALVFAVTPTFWSQSIVAEVYSLHAVFVAGVLLALLRWAPHAADPSGRGRALQVAALYGLSLTHHRAMLLLAPAMLVFILQTLRPVAAPDRRAVYRGGMLALLLVCLLAPLLLYLYIPLRATAAPYYQIELGAGETLSLYDATVAGFIAHVTGSSFGGALQIGAQTQAQIAGLWSRFAGEFTLLGVLLGLVGLFWMLISPARRRKPVTPLLVLTFLAIIAFNLVYGIGDIHVYFIPAYLVWSLWVALGAAALVRLLAAAPAAFRTHRTNADEDLSGSGSPVHLLAPLALLALAALLLTGNFARVDRSADQTARSTWEGILSQPIPEGSLLLSNDRDEMVPQWYLKYVEGVRPDLLGLFPGLQPGDDWANVSQVISRALRAGRPVYAIKQMPGLGVKFAQEGPLVPAAESAGSTEGRLGLLMRITGPAVGKAPDRPLALAYGDALKLVGYDLEPAMASAGGTLAVTLYWQPQRAMARAYTTFVHVVDGDGTVLGQSDQQPGGAYYPTNLWRPGEVLRDEHRVTLTALGRAPYSLVAGAYTVDPELAHLGTPQTIGRIAPSRAADVMPADVTNRAAINFGEQLTLLGHTVTEIQGTVTIRMYWQALQPPANDYTVFVHLLDAQGQIVVQRDQQPTGGQMPTSTWPRGYTVKDEVVLNVPANLAQGTYRLVTGVYHPLSLVRLPATDAEGRPLGDSVPLGEIVRRTN